MHEKTLQRLEEALRIVCTACDERGHETWRKGFITSIAAMDQGKTPGNPGLRKLYEQYPEMEEIKEVRESIVTIVRLLSCKADVIEEECNNIFEVHDEIAAKIVECFSDMVKLNENNNIVCIG